MDIVIKYSEERGCVFDRDMAYNLIDKFPADQEPCKNLSINLFASILPRFSHNKTISFSENIFSSAILLLILYNSLLGAYRISSASLKLKY